MVELTKADIVRHKLVQRIVDAYERQQALREAAAKDGGTAPAQDAPQAETPEDDGQTSKP